MKVYVIRHGLTELNKKKVVNGQIDEPLAPEGIEQAHQVAALIPKSVKHIYTSSLLRARQTGEIVNSTLGVQISSHHELAEIHMGTLAGKSWEEMASGFELKKKHRSVKFNYRPYGGESVPDVKKRVVGFLKKIFKKHKDREVLIITHGGITRLLYLLEQGTEVYETEKHTSLLVFDLDKMLKAS